MSVSYLSAQKSRYRITLDLEVLGDFNPHQVNWDKVFDLGDNESVDAYVEDERDARVERVDDEQVVDDRDRGVARVDVERVLAHHEVLEELVEQHLLPLSAWGELRPPSAHTAAAVIPRQAMAQCESWCSSHQHSSPYSAATSRRNAPGLREHLLNTNPSRDN